MANNSRNELANKIQDNALDLWFDIAFSELKKSNPNDDYKSLLNKCLVGANDAFKLEYLLDRGADLKSPEGLLFAQKYFGNSYNPQSEKIQNKLLDVLKEDYLNLIKPGDNFYKMAHRILCDDTVFSKKIAKLNIDWASRKYIPSSNENFYPFTSSMPFLYYMAKNGPLSTKFFLSSPSCFSSLTKKEKQTYLLNLSFFVYENTYNALLYGPKMDKRSNLSLLNYLTNTMDEKTKNEFIKICFKNGINENLSIDTSLDKNIWSSKLLLPVKKPQTLKRVINKRYKTASDIDFLKENNFDFSSSKAKSFLFNAIEQSNLAVCKKLIDEKVDINHTFPIKKSLNYNFTDDFGVKMSVLDLACATSTPRVVKYFLDKGFDVNGIESEFFLPPLFYAISKGMIENAGVLLSKGANVNIVDNGGRNALWYLPPPRGMDYDNSPVQAATFLIKSKINPFHTANNGDDFVKGYKQKLKYIPFFALYPNKLDYVLSSLQNITPLYSSHELKENISLSSPSSKKKKRKL